MRDSDWLKLKLRLIYLACVHMQILCNGASAEVHNLPFSAKTRFE